jgi:MFS family permease
MAGFSPSDAALEGFRLTRENRKAFGAWVIASFAVSVLAAISTAMMPGDVKRGLETMNSDVTPTAAQFLDALIVISPILLLGLAVQCVMAAAVYRLFFRHDDTRFGYLRLGADELRLMALSLIYVALGMGLVIGVTMVAAIVTALSAFAGPGAEAVVGEITGLLSLGVLFFVLVRLSLAPVATFAERRLAIFESWRLTRGQFWRLSGAYVLAIACMAVIIMLTVAICFGVAGVIVLLSGGQLTDVKGVFDADQNSLKSYLSVGVIASMVISSVLSALWNAVMAAPGAVAYQQLHGDPPARPLTVQPEAG